MKILIWGFGSIGKKHKQGLSSLGANVCVLSSSQKGENFFSTLEEALTAFSPDSILICSPTNSHFENLQELNRCKYSGKIFVEKPLFGDLSEIQKYHFDSLKMDQINVLYNSRFHPLVTKLKEVIGLKQPITSQFYVGQYLPTWRPHMDYRKSYSASLSGGGGVLLDLSHEIDLAQFLSGPLHVLASTGGHDSDLEIETEDHWSILGIQKKCKSTTIHMNYLDQIKRRFLIIHCNGSTFYLDFIKGNLSHNELVLLDQQTMNESYQQMYLKILSNDLRDFCSFSEGLEISRLIQNMKKVSNDQIARREK